MTVRLPVSPYAAGHAVIGIAAFVLFYLFGLSPILQTTLGLPLPIKALLAVVFIAPFGIFLGVPFPTGLAALSQGRRSILPWAWGMNGALSVTGAVLTRIISTSAGFAVVLAAVGLLYVLAAVLFTSAHSSRQPLTRRV